jgi:hypothetical protein
VRARAGVNTRATPTERHAQWRSQDPGNTGLRLGAWRKNPLFTVAILHCSTLFDTVATAVRLGRAPWLATQLGTPAAGRGIRGDRGGVALCRCGDFSSPASLSGLAGRQWRLHGLALERPIDGATEKILTFLASR